MSQTVTPATVNSEITLSTFVSKLKQLLDVWKRLKKNRIAMLGLAIILIQIFAAFFAPVITHYDPNAVSLDSRELAPGSQGHWLGTDDKGRDMYTRLVYGSRISLIVGFSSVALGLLGGITLGLLAGYYPKLDGVIMRVMDIMFAFPGILLAMTIVSALGASLLNVIIAIGIWSIPTLARIVRGSVLTVKKMEYITAVRSLGASDFRILFGHILPNIMAPIIVYSTMRMATSILSTSALSFLGLGAQPPTPEWGAMIATGRDYMYTSPHMTIVPGIAIMLVVFAFNVLGDGLRDALDPNMKV